MSDRTMLRNLAIGSGLELDSCASTDDQRNQTQAGKEATGDRSVKACGDLGTTGTRASIGLSAPVATIPRRVMSFRTIAILRMQQNCGQ